MSIQLLQLEDGGKTSMHTVIVEKGTEAHSQLLPEGYRRGSLPKVMKLVTESV